MALGQCMRKSSVPSGHLIFIEPMQPILVEEPPDSEWSHEVKWDGYRPRSFLAERQRAGVHTARA